MGCTTDEETDRGAHWGQKNLKRALPTYGYVRRMSGDGAGEGGSDVPAQETAKSPHSEGDGVSTVRLRALTSGRAISTVAHDVPRRIGEKEDGGYEDERMWQCRFNFSVENTNDSQQY